jgi:hypothetical protein
MTDIDEHYPTVHHDKVPEWYSCAIDKANWTNRSAILNWLRTTDGGRFWEGGLRVWFEREEDMILFQLTWG